MYSTDFVMRHTGVTMRQLTYWHSKGWLTTEHEGTGHPMEWTADDLNLITYMCKLTQAGFKASNARDIACKVLLSNSSGAHIVRIDLGNKLTLEVK